MGFTEYANAMNAREEARKELNGAIKTWAEECRNSNVYVGRQNLEWTLVDDNLLNAYTDFAEKAKAFKDETDKIIIKGVVEDAPEEVDDEEDDDYPKNLTALFGIGDRVQAVDGNNIKYHGTEVATILNVDNTVWDDEEEVLYDIKLDCGKEIDDVDESHLKLFYPEVDNDTTKFIDEFAAELKKLVAAGTLR